MDKQIIAIWVVIILVLSIVIIVVNVALPVEATTTIYVDDEPGSGPENPPEDYTSIQDAVDNAAHADTIYVYNGTYIENIVVYKKVNLVGENRDTTIISGGFTQDVIKVISSGVNITGFTLKNSGQTGTYAGVYVDRSNDCHIASNNISNNWNGIRLYISNNCNITDNNIFSNQRTGVYSYSSLNNEISNNRVYSNFWYGFYSVMSSNYILLNNTSLNNWDGIFFEQSSSNNVIRSNNLSFNRYKGINIAGSSNNQIIDNIILKNQEHGVQISSTSGCIILNNNISSNSGYGVYLTWTSNINVSNNRFTDDAIFISGGQVSHYNSHIIPVDNMINNKPIHYYKDRNNLLVDGIVAGEIILANCTNSIIRNLDLNGTDLGMEVAYCNINNITKNNFSFHNKLSLYLRRSHFNNISMNTAYSNEVGILLDSSNDNKVELNQYYLNDGHGISVKSSYYNNITKNEIISNNGHGISFTNSRSNLVYKNEISSNSLKGVSFGESLYNDIIDNNISFNNEDGIYLDSKSKNNNFTSNNISHSKQRGFHLFFSTDNKIINNIISFNSGGIYFLRSANNNYVAGNDISSNTNFGIYKYDYSNDNKILNNSITRNKEGIHIRDHSHDNILIGNNVSHNQYGIYLYWASDNLIHKNNVTSNTNHGIYLQYSSNNKMYHNNFIGNNEQAHDSSANANQWDNGYPEGGNHWSDYNGIDLNCSPAQDVPPSDGIGDTPYKIDGCKDNYPLIDPVPMDSIHPIVYGINIDPDPQEVGGNANISSVIWDIYPILGVWIELKDPDGNLIGNFSMDYDSIETKYYYNDTFLDIGNYSFTIYAVDTSNNFGSGHGSFEIKLEIMPPSITNIKVDPDPQEPLEYLNISCNVTDSYGISGVWIEIFNPNGSYFGSFPLTFDSLNGLYYLNRTYGSVGQYLYIISANDSNDNWAYVNGSFAIQDAISPLITDLIQFPLIQESSGHVNISANITDNFQLFGVWISIRDPHNDSTGNISMIYDPTGKRYYINNTYSIPGDHHFTIWANDTSNNSALISGLFIIEDTTSPTIENVTPVPQIQEVGGSVNISATITDNYDLFEAWVDVFDPEGNRIANLSMNYDPIYDRYYINRSFTSIGIHSYMIWANDTEDNWALYSGSYIIQDTAPPMLFSVRAVPNPQDVSKSVNISAIIHDINQVFGAWIEVYDPFFALIGNHSMHQDTTNGRYYWLGSFEDPGIYSYKIFTNDTQDNWAYTSSSFSIQDMTPPAAPSGLMVADGPEEGTLVLNWSANTEPDLAGYDIYRSTSETSGFTRINTELVTDTIYEDSGLTIGESNFYYIIAIDNAHVPNESDRSITVSGTPITIPREPTKLTVSSGDSYAYLAWHAPLSDGGSPINKYCIYRGMTSGEEIFLDKIGNLLFYNDTNVSNGVTYFYRICAENAAGEGPFSNEVTGKPAQIITPESPILDDLETTDEDGAYIVGWNVITNATGYILEEGIDEEFTSSVMILYAGNSTAYSVADRTSGTYYYRVKAITEEVESHWSNVESIEVQIPDEDGDGLPDVWEEENFGNLEQGPEDDPDGDGFTNIEEYQGDSDPNDEHNIPRETGPGSRDNDLISSYWWIILIVILVAFVLIAIISTLKKQRADSMESKQDGQIGDALNYDDIDDKNEEIEDTSEEEVDHI